MQRSIATEDLTSVEWRDTNWIEVTFYFTGLIAKTDGKVIACRRLPEPTNGARLLFKVAFLGSPQQQPDLVDANPIQRFTATLRSHGGSLKVHSGVSYAMTLKVCRKMTGIEFAVIHEQPPVWVIQKRYRRGPAPDDGMQHVTPRRVLCFCC